MKDSIKVTGLDWFSRSGSYLASEKVEATKHQSGEPKTVIVCTNNEVHNPK